MNKSALIIVILVCCALAFGWLQYNDYRVEQGRKAYAKYGCAQCHEAGGAPDLTKVKTKYDRAMVARFIENPEEMYRKVGRRPLNADMIAMPTLHVSRDEAQDLAALLFQR